MTEPAASENALYENLTAAQCLQNAHGHIATAYAQVGSGYVDHAHRHRALREALDAVDWIRRALEHMEKACD